MATRDSQKRHASGLGEAEEAKDREAEKTRMEFPWWSPWQVRVWGQGANLNKRQKNWGLGCGLCFLCLRALAFESFRPIAGPTGLALYKWTDTLRVTDEMGYMQIRQAAGLGRQRDNQPLKYMSKQALWYIGQNNERVKQTQLNYMQKGKTCQDWVCGLKLWSQPEPFWKTKVKSACPSCFPISTFLD